MNKVLVPCLFLALSASALALDYGPGQFASMQADYGINRQEFDTVMAYLNTYDKAPANNEMPTESDNSVSRLMELLPAIYAQDKKALLEVLKFIKTTWKGSWTVGQFRNPLMAMIAADDFNTFKEALRVDRNLAYAPNQYWQSAGPSPIAELVRQSKITWLQYLLDNTYDFNHEPSLYGRGESIYVLNLFSVVSNPKVDELLVQAGVPEVIPRSIESYCTDDNVRVRDNYSLDAKVLFKINKKTPFVITGQSSRMSVIEGLGPGFWYSIKVEGKTGWIFSHFAYVEL